MSLNLQNATLIIYARTRAHARVHVHNTHTYIYNDEIRQGGNVEIFAVNLLPNVTINNKKEKNIAIFRNINTLLINYNKNVHTLLKKRCIIQ